jgi:hypothetical protein
MARGQVSNEEKVRARLNRNERVLRWLKNKNTSNTINSLDEYISRRQQISELEENFNAKIKEQLKSQKNTTESELLELEENFNAKIKEQTQENEKMYQYYRNSVECEC